MLENVHLSSDVFTVCMQHALSTEKQEIMGLLIGQVIANHKLMFVFKLIDTEILYFVENKPMQFNTPIASHC